MYCFPIQKNVLLEINFSKASIELRQKLNFDSATILIYLYVCGNKTLFVVSPNTVPDKLIPCYAQLIEL